MLLQPKHKDLLLSIIKLHIALPIRVLAYGSRVNGRGHSGSDLDLVIQFLDSVDYGFAQFRQLKNAFTHSNLPFIVDAKLWHHLPESFKMNIEKQFVELYNTNSVTT